jgi:hypothetical protein
MEVEERDSAASQQPSPLATLKRAAAGAPPSAGAEGTLDEGETPNGSVGRAAQEAAARDESPGHDKGKEGNKAGSDEKTANGGHHDGEAAVPLPAAGQEDDSQRRPAPGVLAPPTSSKLGEEEESAQQTTPTAAAKVEEDDEVEGPSHTNDIEAVRPVEASKEAAEERDVATNDDAMEMEAEEKKNKKEETLEPKAIVEEKGNEVNGEEEAHEEEKEEEDGARDKKAATERRSEECSDVADRREPRDGEEDDKEPRPEEKTELAGKDKVGDVGTATEVYDLVEIVIQDEALGRDLKAGEVVIDEVIEEEYVVAEKSPVADDLPAAVKLEGKEGGTPSSPKLAGTVVVEEFYPVDEARHELPPPNALPPSHSSPRHAALCSRNLAG